MGGEGGEGRGEIGRHALHAGLDGSIRPWAPHRSFPRGSRNSILAARSPRPVVQFWAWRGGGGEGGGAIIRVRGVLRAAVGPGAVGLHTVPYRFCIVDKQ